MDSPFDCMNARIIAACALAMACTPEAPVGAETSADTSAETSGSTSTTSTSTSAGWGTSDGSDGSNDSDGSDDVTSTTVPSSSTDESGAMLPTPDLGGGGHLQCDIWAQDCPEGEKCAATCVGEQEPVTWNATHCAEVDRNPAQLGDPCGLNTCGLDSCDFGLMCWPPGTCMELCTGSAQAPACSDPETACAIANDGVINLCLAKCDPIIQDCPDDEGCFPVVEDAIFICVVVHRGAGQYGYPCGMYTNNCQPGFMCASAEAVPGCDDIGCCTPYCDLTSVDPDAQCEGQPDGQSCVPYFEIGTAPPGYEHVGVCVIPP